MTDSAVIPVEQERDHKRSMALLKAIGLDKVPPEQRELALAIAKRYDLDLLLKHLVLIDGRPYITRDGLLWVAHRSQQLDGIEVTDPEVVTMPGIGDFWRATCSVYRKDMGRAFTYAGRYPTKGGNQRFAPEMAVKVAEVMALRRAFNVSAPTLEERWDVDPSAVIAIEPEPPLAEAIAERRAAITSGSVTPPQVEDTGPGQGGAFPPSSGEPPHPADHAGARTGRPVSGNPMPAPLRRTTAASADAVVTEAPGIAPLGTAPGNDAEAGASEKEGGDAVRAIAADPARPLCGALPPEDDPLGLAMGGLCELAGEHRVHRNTVGTWPAK